jgi:hypothetical protein
MQNILGIRWLLYVMLLALLSGCASRRVTNYNPRAFDNIESWSVKLAYEAGEVSNTIVNGKVTETKISHSGSSQQELNLREDLYYYLKDSKSITVSPTGDGAIVISIDGTFAGGEISGVTIRLTDAKGETLSRMKIKNGDRVATVKSNEKFVRYIGATIISEIARAKKRQQAKIASIAA